MRRVISLSSVEFYHSENTLGDGAFARKIFFVSTPSAKENCIYLVSRHKNWGRGSTGYFYGRCRVAEN